MDNIESILRNDEKAIFKLRFLYQKYGYSQFKVSKFEEYDLYSQNKNFLVSENILTFTDTNGKLMALKPDVTLSIIKNTKDNEHGLKKLYYNENVYRVTKNSYGYKEILQTGLECIGDLDVYSICEVIMLAAKSLETISADYMLDISNVGIISGILDEIDIPIESKNKILDCMKEKNVHEIEEICNNLGVSSDLCEIIKSLIKIYGPIGSTIDELEKLNLNEKAKKAVDDLKNIGEVMKLYGIDDKIYVDFSIVDDMNYYNGVIFKGFIDGIPSSILSGGRYDNLMHKMGKKSGAIGFAVYLDLLERFAEEENPYDVDVLLLYEDKTEPASIIQAVKMLTDNGKTVKVEKTKDENIKYKQLLCVKPGGLEIIETND